MKKILLLFIFLFSLKISAQTLTFTFSGLIDSTQTEIDLDSIMIENLSNGTDTLVYTNSINLEISTLINENIFNENNITVFPNPFNGTTKMAIVSGSYKSSLLNIYTCDGVLLTNWNGYLNTGENIFQIYSSVKGILFVHVLSNDIRQTIKILCNSENNNSNIQLIGNTKINTIDLAKSTLKSINNTKQAKFSFSIGDNLKFIGYSDTLISNVLIDDPQESKSYTLLFGDNSIIDLRDNQIYKTVKIGNQVWMAENLNYTTDTGSWVYDNDISNAEIYGRLYNWETAQTVCPDGWHLPSNDELTELESYLIANGYNYNGSTTGEKTGKSLASTIGWESCVIIGSVGNDQQSNNSSGFNAFPSGWRNVSGDFDSKNKGTLFWSSDAFSSDRAWSWRLFFEGSGFDDHTVSKALGCSVRCIKD